MRFFEVIDERVQVCKGLATPCEISALVPPCYEPRASMKAATQTREITFAKRCGVVVAR